MLLQADDENLPLLEEFIKHEETIQSAAGAETKYFHRMTRALFHVRHTPQTVSHLFLCLSIISRAQVSLIITMAAQRRYLYF